MAILTKLISEDFLKRTPEEILEYIQIAEEALVEILSQRGMTVEEFRERRKQIIAAEREAIAAKREAIAAKREALE